MDLNNNTIYQYQNGSINLSLLKQNLSKGTYPPSQWVKQKLLKVLHIVKNQPNILYLDDPITIVGDIHGQFYDLLKILSLTDSFDQKQLRQNILFLGDYVDRGAQGIEVVILLCALKFNYPNQVFLLRGNHQTREMTQTMNFFTQAIDKYNKDIYFDIMDVFDSLPFACVVNKAFFCVHGGISSKAQSIQELMKLDRFDQTPLSGTLCDLVWSDPINNDQGIIANTKEDQNLYVKNSQRNCSIYYGKDLTKKFLKENGLVTIIRAHQMQISGFRHHQWSKKQKPDYPKVFTLFSAPNYCGTYDNFGAILRIQNKKFNVRQFKQSNPKYWVPSKFDAFSICLDKIINVSDVILRKIVSGLLFKKIKNQKAQFDLQKLPIELLVFCYFKYKNSNKKQSFQSKKPQLKLINKLSQQKNIQSVSIQKINSYYQQSQKRPSSMIGLRRQQSNTQKFNTSQSQILVIYQKNPYQRIKGSNIL